MAEKVIKKGRPSIPKERVERLKSLGVFTPAEAQKLKISQPTLSRLVAQGVIVSARRGYYVHPESELTSEHYDFAIAQKRFGKETSIGGLTALSYHGLLDRSPKQIWVIVASPQKTSSKLFRCLRTKLSLKWGVEVHPHYRITGIERTLIDALYFSSKVGLDIALRAMRTAISEKKTTLNKIYALAKKMKVQHLIEKHWEAITA